MNISEALEKHCRFLAYVRVNALLHDCDKSFADFLLWSLLPQKRRSDVPNYDEHNKSKEPGEASLKREDYLQYWQSVVAGTTEDLDAAASIPFPAPSCYAAYLDEKGKEKYHITQEQTIPCHSIYDFFTYHHDWPNCIDQAKASTALFLFISGVAGIDGNDTGYETEMEAHQQKQRENNKTFNYNGHHVPDTTDKKIVLISTPFGFERDVALKCAETACHFSQEIGEVAFALRDDKQPMSIVAQLEEKIEQPFRDTIIRTTRPVNDVTLADHSISTAALTVAQAAKVVLENIAAPENSAYCLPVRRPREDVPSQQTSFAAFSCAVNADKLDQMALELKDITAIRDEVKKLLEHFLSLFSEKYPVGGKAYQDQHGAHVIVPVLGNPAKRWIKGGTDRLIRLETQEQPEWADAPPDALTNDQFVDWLFATAKEELLKVEVNFGVELLIGLRYKPILQKLNRLAHAINWSRSLSSLSMMAGRADRNKEKIHAFNYGRDETKEAEFKFDLCGVCSLRQGIPENKHRKCGICEQRTDRPQTYQEETGDIEKLALGSDDNRMVLLTVSFNLSQWLAETSNSGIFCHESNDPKKWSNQKKKENYQRFNSFGRFRRIWRSTEIFLEQLRDQIREISGRDKEKENNPYLMRTILLAPQDLQIILPAAKAREALDAVYAKFREEFGRVSDRMPFHVSLCIFPFRVPIYLVLKAARRLRQSCLKSELKETELSVCDEILLRTDTRENRCFTYPLPMIWTQAYQPGNVMNGNDQFHANICIDKNKPKQWLFIGEVQSGQQAWMNDNRLAIVEIHSGFSLDELAQPSEKLEPSRCHDIPLGYWPCLKELIRLESRLSEKQQRGLRSVLAMREKLWQESDLPGATPEEKDTFLRQSIQLLWQEPSRFGPKGWGKLDDYEKNLLVESCLNGAVFLASAVKKHLQNNDDKEQDHG
jgi:hypothetical protein